MKTALITGASEGIGKVIALKLAKLGFNTAIVARSRQLLSELKSEIESFGSINIGSVVSFKLKDKLKKKIKVLVD